GRTHRSPGGEDSSRPRRACELIAQNLALAKTNECKPLRANCLLPSSLTHSLLGGYFFTASKGRPSGWALDGRPFGAAMRKLIYILLQGLAPLATDGRPFRAKEGKPDLLQPRRGDRQ